MSKSTKRLLRGLAPAAVVTGVIWLIALFVPQPYGLPAMLTWAALAFVALPCVSRFFASQNCLTFAVRLRLRRGGRIIVRSRTGSLPNFAVDFGDRIVYIAPPPWHPRMYIKSRAATVNLSWDQV